MKFNMPMAVFGGLALIAAAIYFGSGSAPVNAAGGVQRIAICDVRGSACVDIVDMNGIVNKMWRRGNSIGITGY